MFTYYENDEIYSIKMENKEYELEIPKEIKEMTLNYAIKTNRVDDIERQIKKTKDMNKKIDEMLPLKCAIKFSTIETIEKLLIAGADPSINDIILDVAYEKKYDILRLFLKYYPKYVDYKDKYSGERTLLYVLSEQNSFKEIEYLIELGANIHIKTSVGSNLLHMLCIADQYDNHKEAIVYWLRKGVKINEVNNFKQTPLYISLTNSFVIAELLIENGASLEIEGKSIYDILKEEKEKHDNEYDNEKFDYALEFLDKLKMSKEKREVKERIDHIKKELTVCYDAGWSYADRVKEKAIELKKELRELQIKYESMI